jgi:hypothetical protein
MMILLICVHFFHSVRKLLCFRRSFVTTIKEMSAVPFLHSLLREEEESFMILKGDQHVATGSMLHAAKQKQASDAEVQRVREPFLTVPSAASRVSSSAAIAPDQNEKRRRKKKKGKEERKEKKKDGVASPRKGLVGAGKAGGLYTKPFLCPSVNMFSIAESSG